MIKVTYSYPTAEGNTAIHTYICQTDEQTAHICKMVEDRKDSGYKLVDVTQE